MSIPKERDVAIADLPPKQRQRIHTLASRMALTHSKRLGGSAKIAALDDALSHALAAQAAERALNQRKT